MNQRIDPVPSGAVVAAADDLTKVYGEGEARVIALAGVSARFRQGEFTAIMGPSGSGKSTFMHCLAGLDTPTSGSARIGEIDLAQLDDARLTKVRRERIGFIFQAFNLLPTLTALENITLPAALAGQNIDRKWLDHLLATMGIADRLDHRPAQLSGGQQQRVACARALASRPAIVFADEPTGNLDSRSGAEVLALLRSASRDMGQTIVMVTHDPVAAAHADRALFLADGRIVHEMPRPTTSAVLEQMKHLDAHQPSASL
ncbi:ABC transporter ATP-binding protein [Sphaerimonospora thailandensis]|uniref:ABC transporter ATP-binding protein n=1 Tax=Sphaerimonospora thailandensis TaxID=795644 RepID=A0A8J3RDN6_9ACTN|nr:ABC transporter ATP-binding protein [Sphaerimonospora thailandensis]GIH71874.1 ABC transporter ATP-binding protein [Sphaerimonospora thailandensis]